eukprot:m.327000 g.327000  ORF g.327000 m.327000 type:complete len:109 (-) comp55578_c0_seq37:173-499(-)
MEKEKRIPIPSSYRMAGIDWEAYTDLCANIRLDLLELCQQILQAQPPDIIASSPAHGDMSPLHVAISLDRKEILSELLECLTKVDVLPDQVAFLISFLPLLASCLMMI